MSAAERKVCMVVGESASARQSVAAMLGRLHYCVVEAENGFYALERIREAPPDVILLDWNMPGMDGLECLKRLRSLDGGRRPAVVMCTSEYTLAKIAAAMQEGADEYLVKPFDFGILKDRLELLGLMEDDVR